MRIGTDGLSVMVHPDNDFVDCLTVGELNEIWKARLLHQQLAGRARRLP